MTSTLPAEIFPSAPAWLAAFRQRAWEQYEKTPPPTRSEEGWRRTPMKGLLPSEIQLPNVTGISAKPTDLSPGSLGRMQVDGQPVSELVGGALPAGVTFGGTAEALGSDAGVFQSALEAGGESAALESGRFAFLRRALLSGGYSLHVPAGVKVTIPLHGIHHILRNGLTHFPYTLIRAGEGSEVTFVEEFGSRGAVQAFTSPQVDVVLEAGAHVRYVQLQDEDAGISHLGEFRAFVGRDAKITALFVATGAGVARNAITTFLNERGSSAELFGVVLGAGTQHLEHHIRAEHIGTDTSSDLLFKAAVRDTSRSVFTGNIQIRKSAHRSTGLQTLRNLVLSEGAKADAVPNLEIEADDVACKHAASVGPPDAETLFYLRTRGIQPRAAEQLVVEGFVEDALRRFESDPASPLAAWLSARLSRYWEGHPPVERT